MKLLKWHSLHEKCPYSEFLWSIISRIRTECREIHSRKLRTGKTPNTDTLHAVVVPLSKVLYEFDRNICEIVADLIEIYWCIKITVISTSSTHLNAVTWQYFFWAYLAYRLILEYAFEKSWNRLIHFECIQLLWTFISYFS